MIFNADIHPDWNAPDIALFVALVASVQNAVGVTVGFHQRSISDDRVQDVIAKALLVALKAEGLTQGFRQKDMSLAFIEYEARLRSEIIDLKQAKQNFVESLHFLGRA